MQPLLKPPWSLLIASRKSPNSLIGCINLFPDGLQPSWPWALPLYIRPQLPHSLDLTFSHVSKIWRFFFPLGKHINFFCLSDTSLSFKTSGFVGGTESQAKDDSEGAETGRLP